jgi:hypothetical protein
MNGKVRIGFFSFTEITDPAEHRSYNEWHMYDHMPEQFPIGGIVYGQRWVSTPACTANRAASRGPLAATHYLTLYLMSDPVRETLREFYEHGRALAKLGRFHQHRRALLSGPFVVNGMAAAPRVLVRAEAVPYRPHSGVYVIVDSEPLALDEFVAAPGVVGAWSFAGTDEYTDLPWATRGRGVTVCWLDGDAPAVDATTAEFAGPFETIGLHDWNWFE